MASGEEPPLVSAVVRELTHDPNSSPLEFRNIPGKPSPAWSVRLEINQVLRGDPDLKGKSLITSTADSPLAGNGRFVTPRLNEGDVGIWAIKRLADGSWAEVYSPYEVEKGIRLPLIKGRHDEFEKVLLRLSGEKNASHPSRDAKVQEALSKTAPAMSSEQLPAGEKPPEQMSATSTSNTKPLSSTPWGVIAVLIVAAVGLLWLLLKRRS